MDDASPQKRWLTIEELHAYTGFSVSCLYKKVSKREIPHNRVNGLKSLRFDRLKIDKWLEGREVRPVSEMG